MEPPVHDALRFGKEAMAADIDAIALEIDSPADTPHVFAFLQYDRPYAGTCKEFVSGRQAGRTGAGDDSCFRAIHGSLRSMQPEIRVSLLMAPEKLEVLPYSGLTMESLIQP